MSWTGSGDPYKDFDNWDAEQHKELGKLPICSECGEHIQDDEAYYINGDWICEECMDSHKREVWYED